MPIRYKAGEAPWEVEEQRAAQEAAAKPMHYPAGQAPWETIAIPQEPIPSNSRPELAALQGFGQGASFGYIPELQAKLAAYLDPSSTYEQELKHFRAREAGLQESNPLAYGAGAVGGGLAIPTPGVSVAKGGGALARIAKAAASGGAMGLVMNPGETEDEFAARMEQAKQGALLSGGLSTAGAALAKAGQGLKKGKEALAMKLAGARKAHVKEFPAGSVKRTELVNFMEKEGMLRPGQSFETVNEKASNIVQKEGEKIGKIHQSVTDDVERLASQSPELAAAVDKTKLTARDLAASVLKDARNQFKGQAEGKQALSALRSEMRNLSSLDKSRIDTKVKMVPGAMDYATGTRQMIPQVTKTRVKPETPFTKILDYRKTLDDTLNYQSPLVDSSAKEKALRFARTKIKEKLDARISSLDKIASKAGSKETVGRVEQLKKLNDRYSKASTLRRISGDRLAGEEGKAGFGLLEVIAGTGAGTGAYAQGENLPSALGKAAIGGLAFKGARKFGPGLSYNALKTAEKLGPLGRSIQSIPPGAYLSPWLLMNQEK